MGLNCAHTNYTVSPWQLLTWSQWGLRSNKPIAICTLGYTHTHSVLANPFAHLSVHLYFYIKPAPQQSSGQIMLKLCTDSCTVTHTYTTSEADNLNGVTRREHNMRITSLHLCRRDPSRVKSIQTPVLTIETETKQMLLSDFTNFIQNIENGTIAKGSL